MTKMSIICSLAGVALIYGGALHMRANITPISQIDESFVGLKTKISGKIIDINEHPENHIFLKIQDQSKGTISAPIFSGVRNKLNDPIELGDNIQISGKIEKYQGKLEILPQDPNSLKIISKPPIGVSNLDNTKVGEIVKVRGIFTERNAFNNNSFTLREKGSSIIVKIMDKTKKNFLDLQRGDLLEVIGRIKSNRDGLEILVNTRNLKVIED